MAERVARGLVRDRERLWALAPGGSAERPIDVTSSAVIEVKARATPCPQCEGTLRLEDHQAVDAALRKLDVRCVLCGVPRSLYFRIVPTTN